MITRRDFVIGSGSSLAGLLWEAAGSAACKGQTVPAPLIDLHIHLFGTGDAGTGCRLSKQITEGLPFQIVMELLRIKGRARTLDESYLKVLVEHLAGSGLDKGVILGQDAVYDRRGRRDWGRTHFYTPNDYVLRVTNQHARQMLPCPSINPNRADAVAELERCHGKGARVFKIHPPTQGVDIADRKHRRFFQRCADLDMRVMVHTGHEHSAPVIDVGLAGPSKLVPALELGCRVVACHCGTGWGNDRPRQLPEFLAMLRKYPRLWGDTAVLGTPGRVRDFGLLLKDKVAPGRLLHGSDFPFPCSPAAFAARIGSEKARQLEREPNWLKRDLALKEALGIGMASARRAGKVLDQSTKA
jgi:mannonate dehydratase